MGFGTGGFGTGARAGDFRGVEVGGVVFCEDFAFGHGGGLGVLRLVVGLKGG